VEGQRSPPMSNPHVSDVAEAPSSRLCTPGLVISRVPNDLSLSRFEELLGQGDRLLECSLSRRRVGEQVVGEGVAWFTCASAVSDAESRIKEAGFAGVECHQALPWSAEERRRGREPAGSFGVRVGGNKDDVDASGASVITDDGVLDDTTASVASTCESQERIAAPAAADSEPTLENELTLHEFWCSTCEIAVRGPGPLSQLRDTHETGSRHTRCLRIGPPSQRGSSRPRGQVLLEGLQKGSVCATSAQEAVKAFPDDLRIELLEGAGGTRHSRLSVIATRKRFPMASWKTAVQCVLKQRGICGSQYFRGQCVAGANCLLHHDITQAPPSRTLGGRRAGRPGAPAGIARAADASAPAQPTPSAGQPVSAGGPGQYFFATMPHPSQDSGAPSAVPCTYMPAPGLAPQPGMTPMMAHGMTPMMAIVPAPTTGLPNQFLAAPQLAFAMGTPVSTRAPDPNPAHLAFAYGTARSPEE